MRSKSGFLKLVNTHSGILVKVSRMYFDDPGDQEELRQEITARLWESFGSFRGESKFSSWMYRVALNTAITTFKKTKQRREVPLDNALNISSTTESSEEQQKLAAFYHAVHSLDRIEKAIIFLYLEGCTHREIGQQLGISEGNARVRLSRTKTKLTNQLTEKDDEF